MKNYKTELTRALVSFGAEYRTLTEQAAAVRIDVNLSDTGRATQIVSLQERLAASGASVAARAAELVAEAIAALQTQWEAPINKITDSGYQAGLSNAVLMLKSGVVSRDDIPAILRQFEGDFSAVELLKVAAKESAKYAGVAFPADNRAHTLALLDQLKSNLSRLAGARLPASNEKPWNAFNNGGLINASIEVDSLLEFIDTLTEELEPPAQTVPLFTMEEMRQRARA